MTRASNSTSFGNQSTASELAIAALGYLASDAERLEKFLAMSGLGPHNLRRAAADPAFLGAVLDYVVADEKLLVAFAGEQGRSPTLVMRARDALGGPPPLET